MCDELREGEIESLPLPKDWAESVRHTERPLVYLVGVLHTRTLGNLSTQERGACGPFKFGPGPVANKAISPHLLRVILELEDSRWLVSDRGFGETPDWHEFVVDLPSFLRRELDIQQVEARGIVKEPNLERVRSVGWTDMLAGSDSKGCTRVDWTRSTARPRRWYLPDMPP